MFCPRCGSNQSDELRFCKLCGANLYAVRKVVDTRENEVTDRGQPWFAEMALSDAESKRRKEELDHRRGIAPEVRRSDEIKGGIITGSTGIGLMIFLYVFMQGLVLSGKVAPDTAEILGRLWVVGVIPVLIGVALIINGVFVSRRLVEIARQAAQNEPNVLDKDTHPLSLQSGDSTEFISSGFSVTDGTTKHLRSKRNS
jgi:hypothetical protein